jgi:hypothetical protein
MQFDALNIIILLMSQKQLYHSLLAVIYDLPGFARRRLRSIFPTVPAVALATLPALN